MNAESSEQDDNLQLLKAKEAIAYYREKENEARRELASAMQSTRIAKEKYEALFAACEARAVSRRKAGLIPVNPGY